MSHLTWPDVAESVIGAAWWFGMRWINLQRVREANKLVAEARHYVENTPDPQE